MQRNQLVTSGCITPFQLLGSGLYLCNQYVNSPQTAPLWFQLLGSGLYLCNLLSFRHLTLSYHLFQLLGSGLYLCNQAHGGIDNVPETFQLLGSGLYLCNNALG